MNGYLFNVKRLQKVDFDQNVTFVLNYSRQMKSPRFGTNQRKKWKHFIFDMIGIVSLFIEKTQRLIYFLFCNDQSEHYFQAKNSKKHSKDKFCLIQFVKPSPRAIPISRMRIIFSSDVKQINKNTENKEAFYLHFKLFQDFFVFPIKEIITFRCNLKLKHLKKHLKN